MRPRVNPGAGNQRVQYRFPEPSLTPAGQALNTGASLAALGFICLQSYWGNPIFMWGCGGLIIRLILKIGHIENL